jgi:hypothetical protein
LPLECAI